MPTIVSFVDRMVSPPISMLLICHPEVGLNDGSFPRENDMENILNPFSKISRSSLVNRIMGIEGIFLICEFVYNFKIALVLITI